MTGRLDSNIAVSNRSEPGLPALVKRLNAYWRLSKWNHKADCDMLDDPRSMLTTLAIPLDKAHALWGYIMPLGGSTAGAQAPIQHELPTLVFDALENWESWASSAQGDYITAVQFLAVIFWILRADTTTPDDEKKIVEQWADLLRSASNQRGRGLNEPLPRRLVTPRDSVTRIPAQTKAPDGWDWSLLVSDADNFLAANDLELSVRKIALYWLTGDEAGLKVVEAPIFSVPVAQPTRTRGSAWTDDELKALIKEFDGTPGKTVLARREVIAGRRGTSAANIKKYLAKAREKLPTSAAASSPFTGLGRRRGS